MILGPRLPLAEVVHMLGGDELPPLCGDPQVMLHDARELLATATPWGGLSPWDDSIPDNVRWIDRRRTRCSIDR